MKNLLIVIFLILAGVVGVGFYRGWFSVLWERGDGKAHITGTIDSDKVKEDLRTK